MQLDLTQPIRTDPDTAYNTMWERFTDLPAFLPNVASITETERNEIHPDEARTVHRWAGDPAVIPAALRKAAPANMLEWDGHAHWQHRARRVDFTFLAAHFQGLYRCTGSFAVAPDGTQSTVQILADLEIYGDRLPGIPKALGRGISRRIEKVIVGIINPSLRALPGAVEAFL